MNTSVWAQKNGSRISVKDMSDLHISNTIKMLQRNIASLGQAVVMHDEIHDHLTIEALSQKKEWEKQIEAFQRELNHRQTK